MNCPSCSALYQPGDRFCGNCGERLPQDAVPARADAGAAMREAAGRPGAEPTIADLAESLDHPASASSATCPVCGATLLHQAARCEVCGFEPGASVIVPAGLAQQAPRPQPSPPPAARAEPATPARVCNIHGPLDPSWTRCPYCLKEGREGRLPSGPVGLEPPMGSSIPAMPSVPPRMEPAEAIVPSAPSGSTGGPAAMPAASPAPPPNAPSRPPDLPRSSVGATFAIRRRPRILAYLIEKEGEAVGRVHQLDDDVTDIGRDPRNHIVLSDVMISGFHARVERGPDGTFIVQDRQSTNGTLLNGEPLTDMRAFKENDELRLGSTTLVLKVVT
jgi:hypothetical protein